MKINCDLGESYGAWHVGQNAQHDETIMAHIDQANIACGFHAGDPVVMTRTIEFALAHHVSIGAHPSYPDIQGFGRRSMKMEQSEIVAMCLYQISALDGMASSLGGRIDYVKPHGALYNDMMTNSHVRKSVLQAMATYHRTLPLMVQSTPEFEVLEVEAKTWGIELLAEVFADRLYQEDGRLTARSHQCAVHDLDKALAQVACLINHQEVECASGKRLKLKVDSICLHGDTDFAAELASSARRLINETN